MVGGKAMSGNLGVFYTRITVVFKKVKPGLINQYGTIAMSEVFNIHKISR